MRNVFNGAIQDCRSNCLRLQVTPSRNPMSLITRLLSFRCGVTFLVEEDKPAAEGTDLFIISACLKVTPVKEKA